MHRNSPNYQRSLVLLKPDTVQRGLVGQVLTRFEQKGLQISAIKMVWPNEESAGNHYGWSKEEKIASGERTIEIYKKKGIDRSNEDPEKIGEEIMGRLVRFLTTGPIVALVIEGIHSIEWIRKLVGHGSPLQADVGTIRADFAVDSYPFADETERVTRNLIHASSSPEEAEREIAIWFDESEIFDYDTAVEKILYHTEWEDDTQASVKKRRDAKLKG